MDIRKGLSISEVLLPNHKYFIYPNQYEGRNEGEFGQLSEEILAKAPFALTLPGTQKHFCFVLNLSFCWNTAIRVCSADKLICQYPGLNLKINTSVNLIKVTSFMLATALLPPKISQQWNQYECCAYKDKSTDPPPSG